MEDKSLFIKPSKKSNKSIVKLYLLKKCNPTEEPTKQERIAKFKDIIYWLDGAVNNQVFMTKQDIQNKLGYLEILPPSRNYRGYFLVPQDYNIFVEMIRCIIISSIHNVPIRNNVPSDTSKSQPGVILENNVKPKLLTNTVTVRLGLEIQKMKNYQISIMETTDIEKFIQDYSEQIYSSPGAYYWSQIRMYQSEKIGLHVDLQNLFPSSYFTSKQPTHINQSEMDEKMITLASRLSILFNNNNKSRHLSYNLISEEADKPEEHDDISSDFMGDFVLLSPKQIFDIIYYVGNFSLFDIGFQLQLLNKFSIETTNKSITDLISETSKKSQFLCNNQNDDTCNKFSNIWRFNTCPLCSHHVNLLKTMKLDKCINHQFETSNASGCRSVKMTNSELYAHLKHKTTSCWIHQIFLKYIETMYPRSMWSSVSEEKINPSDSKCKNVNYSTTNSQMISSIFKLYSLTR